MPILGRAASGGLAGAAMFVAEDRRATTGAALGASAAVAAAFAGESLRSLAGQTTGLPDPAVGLAEDALILVVGSLSSKDDR